MGFLGADKGMAMPDWHVSGLQYCLYIEGIGVAICYSSRDCTLPGRRDSWKPSMMMICQ